MPIESATIDELRSVGTLAYHVMSPMQDTYGVDRAHPVSAQRADMQVMVAYDLIPFLFPDQYLGRDNVLGANIGRLRRMKTADLLLAISECTRRDVIEHLAVEPQRVHTIGTGVSEQFTAPALGADPIGQARRRFPAIDRPFVLSVPAFEWRKNTEALIQAFARLPVALRTSRQLVLACPLPPRAAETWRRCADVSGMAPEDLVLTGFVEDVDLRTLYQAADLFVFPSRYEGFGLPVAEAACCGTPSLTSSAGSLPEILDCPASLFDPDDIGAMTAGMAAALEPGPLRDTLVSATAAVATTHTWPNVARRTLNAYAMFDRLSIYPSSRRNDGPAADTPQPPRRVAWVGLPEPSRPALDLVVSRGAWVDVFVEGVAVGLWPPAAAGRRVFPVSAFGTVVNPYDYDAVVYCVTAQGVETFDALSMRPGIVWLYDSELEPLIAAVSESRARQERYGPEPRRKRLASEITAELRDELYPRAPDANFQPRFVAAVARNATQLCVTSLEVLGAARTDLAESFVRGAADERR